MPDKTTQVTLIATGKDRRLNIRAYNGGLIQPMINKESTALVVVDIATMRAGDVEILIDHDPRQKIGTGKAAKGDGLVMVAGALDPSSNYAAIVTDAHEKQTGEYRQASIGCSFSESDAETIEPGRTLTANGQAITSDKPFSFIRNCVLNEVSVLNRGADSNSLTLAAKATTMTTTTETEPTSDQTDAILELLASDDAKHLESADIKSLRAKAMDGTIDLDTVSRQIKLSAKLADLDIKSGGPGASFRPQHGGNEIDTLTAGLLMKAGLAPIAEKVFDARTLQAAQLLARMHNMDLCKHALTIEGRSVPSDRNQLFAGATSTYSLPTALNNAMNKTLEHVFRDSPATWRSFARIKFANDFKEQTGLRSTLLGEMAPIAKDGEIKHGGITEAVYNWQVKSFGKIIFITRTDWMNDDTGFLNDIAPGFGRMAARGVSDLVYRTILNDSTFFSTGNGNLATGGGSPLSVTSLSTAIIGMRKQTDENGDSIDIEPMTLVVPPELEDTAKVILASRELDRTAAAVDRAPMGNPHEARLSLEVEPRLSNSDKYENASTTGWYIFGSPMDNAFTVGFLGSESPMVEFFGFDHEAKALRAGWRVYNDYGAAFAEHRAAFKSAGA